MSLKQLAETYEQAGHALDLATPENRAAAYAAYVKAQRAYEDRAGESVPLEEAQQAELTLALKLAIQAPTEGLARECVAIAESIAQDMTRKQVEICKAAAECAVEYEATYSN